MDNPFANGPSSVDWSCNVKKSYKICCLPGDGIGPEVIAEGKKVLAAVGEHAGVEFTCEDALIGGAAIDATGEPLPQATFDAAQASDAVLLASVGGPRPVPSRGSWAFARRSGCTPTFAPSKSTMPWRAPPRLSPKSSRASTW